MSPLWIVLGKTAERLWTRLSSALISVVVGSRLSRMCRKASTQPTLRSTSHNPRWMTTVIPSARLTFAVQQKNQGRHSKQHLHTRSGSGASKKDQRGRSRTKLPPTAVAAFTCHFQQRVLCSSGSFSCVPALVFTCRLTFAATEDSTSWCILTCNGCESAGDHLELCELDCRICQWGKQSNR